MQKTLFLYLGLAFLIFAAGCYGNPPTTDVPGNPPAATTSNQSNLVTIQNFAFSPATLTIAAGTTVTWQNQDSVTHTVTGTAFDSGNLEPGQAFSFTFKQAGTYAYHCTPHPRMQGEIGVR